MRWKLLSFFPCILALPSRNQYPLSLPQQPHSADSTPLQVDDTRNFSSSSHLIFASVAGLLQQWPNTLYPNGHSIVLGTIPESTLLYHARKDADLPPKIEWLAFDSEMSYGIMALRGGYTAMLTYAAARPLRVMYLDGLSAALGGTGWLDSQSVLIYGNVTGGNDQGWGGGWVGSEYAQASSLCAMADNWGFDGVVRTNAGFEVVYCHFGEGLDLVSHVNVTDPFSEAGNGFPSPPDSPDRVPQDVGEDLNLVDVRFPAFEDPPPRGPGESGGPRGPGRPPYGGRRGPGRGPGRQASVFTSISLWEWQTSASWHYTSGEARVILDYSTLVSFYDPRVRSLAQMRAGNGTELTRSKQRLVGISKGDAKWVKEEVEAQVRRKNREGWQVRVSAVDWKGLVGSVVERWEERLLELQWTVTNGTGLNATARAVAVRGETYALIMPYLNMSNFTTKSTSWIDSSRERCRTAFTHRYRQRHLRNQLSRSEELLIRTIEDVLDHTCRDVITIFSEIITLALPLDHRSPMADEATRARVEVEAARKLCEWREIMDSLIEWLGWAGAQSLKCDRVCNWDEICQIEMWPIVFRASEAFKPKCVSRGTSWG